MAITYGYIRVSTADQNEARQIKAPRGQSLVSHYFHIAADGDTARGISADLRRVDCRSAFGLAELHDRDGR